MNLDGKDSEFHFQMRINVSLNIWERKRKSHFSHIEPIQFRLHAVTCLRVALPNQLGLSANCAINRMVVVKVTTVAC